MGILSKTIEYFRSRGATGTDQEIADSAEPSLRDTLGNDVVNQGGPFIVPGIVGAQHHLPAGPFPTGEAGRGLMRTDN